MGEGAPAEARSLRKAAAWAILALGLDQASKAWVRNVLPLGSSRPVWEGVFHLTHVGNLGAAFGLLPGQDLPLLLLPALVTLAAVWLVPALAPRHPVAPVSLGLIVGGALGNLIDRVTRGVVTDFLDFRVWPVFNLADVFITTGASFLVLSLLIREVR